MTFKWKYLTLFSFERPSRADTQVSFLRAKWSRFDKDISWWKEFQNLPPIVHCLFWSSLQFLILSLCIDVPTTRSTVGGVEESTSKNKASERKVSYPLNDRSASFSKLPKAAGKRKMKNSKCARPFLRSFRNKKRKIRVDWYDGTYGLKYINRIPETCVSLSRLFSSSKSRDHFKKENPKVHPVQRIYT